MFSLNYKMQIRIFHRDECMYAEMRMLVQSIDHYIRNM